MATPQVDLSNCDREPIHVPGAIQPHGVLLACRGPAFTIVQVSDNSEAVIGTPPGSLLGRPMAELLRADSWERLAAAGKAGLPREVNPICLELRDGTSFDGIVHTSATAGVAIVELEGLRILVIEDEPDARQMLTTLLEACKSEVRAVASGYEALDLLAVWRPDVIVSDVGMPEMDGFSFIEQLRRRPAAEGGGIPAIALTAHARVEHRARALYSGFTSHVPKPVEPVELFAVIASVRSRNAGS